MPGQLSIVLGKKINKYIQKYKKKIRRCFFILRHIIIVTRYLHVREQNVRWFFSLGQRINFLYIAYEFIVLPEWDLFKDDFPTERVCL